MSSEKKGTSVSDNTKIDLAELADVLEALSLHVACLEDVFSVLIDTFAPECKEYGGVAFCAMKAAGSLSDEIAENAFKLRASAETGGQSSDQ